MFRWAPTRLSGKPNDVCWFSSFNFRMRCVQHRRFRYDSTRNFHFGHQKRHVTTSKVNAKSGKFLGFWIHLAPKPSACRMWSRGHPQHLANVIGYTSRLTSRFFKTKVAHSGHDHRGTQLAHAAMGYPAASSHEAPQGLWINRQRAAKFGCIAGPRSSGTWLLQMVALKSVKFCCAPGTRSAGTWVLQMVPLKSLEFCCCTGPRSAATWVLQMVALKSVKSCCSTGSRSAGTWVLQMVALKSVKFGSTSNSRSAGTWVLQMVALKSLKFCLVACPRSAGTSVLQMVALKSVKFRCHTGSRSAGT